MFDISNNGIMTITRGDTAVANLQINLGTTMFPEIFDLRETNDEGEKLPEAKIFLGIMEPNQPFEKAIVKKIYTAKDYSMQSHTVRIKFESSDTENLLPGVYYYSIKLYRPQWKSSWSDKPGDNLDFPEETNDRIDTIISKKKFIILD